MPRKITANTVTANTNNTEDTTEHVVVRKKGGRRPKVEVDHESHTNQEVQDTQDTHQVQETQPAHSTHNSDKGGEGGEEWEEGDGVQVITHPQQEPNSDEQEHESEPIQVTMRSEKPDNRGTFSRASRQQHNPRNQHQSNHRHPRTETNGDARHTQRPKSAALSFSYDDYNNFAEPAHKASTPDLLRVLIARAHEDGQVHLKRCLETTLRAVNLECKFPTLPPPRRTPFNAGNRE